MNTIGRRPQGEIMRFVTIREVAKTGLLSEHALRVMVRRGEVPGFRSGNRFYVNFNKLVEKLEGM